MQRVKKIGALFGIALGILVGCSTLLQPSASAHSYYGGGWRSQSNYGYGWHPRSNYGRFPRYQQAYYPRPGGFFGGNNYGPHYGWREHNRNGWGNNSWGHHHHSRW